MMTKTSSEQQYLIGKDVTLEQWLELMEKRPKNVTFEHYQFPTDAIKEQFLASSSIYSDQIVTKILNSFLLPLGTFLGSDQRSVDDLIYLLSNNPEEAKRLMKSPYYQRLITYVISKGETPVRDGIAWILDLLPFSPREALDA